MSRPPDPLRFTPPDWQEVIAAMHELAEVRGGWINLQPDLDDEVRAMPGPGLLGLLGARGPLAPLCTWHPGEGGRRPTPPSVGIQHATGTRAAARLVDAGRGVPDGWRVTQDHPRRGLVVVTPPGERNDDVLRWLIAAGEALCPEPVDAWMAWVHR
jgi:hypothetical protein